MIVKRDFRNLKQIYIVINIKKLICTHKLHKFYLLITMNLKKKKNDMKK